MNKVAKYILIYTGVFAAATAATIFIAKPKPIEPPEEQEEDRPVKDTAPFAKMLNYLSDNQFFNVSANAIVKVGVDTIVADIKGQVDKRSFEDLDAWANVHANVSGEDVDLSATYISQVVTLDAFDNYFKASIDDINDFIDLVDAVTTTPTSNQRKLLPLKKYADAIDWQDVLIAVGALEETDKKQAPNGDYYFPIKINNEEVDIIVSKSSEDRVLGLKTESLTIDEVNIKADIRIEDISSSEIHIENPLQGPNKDKYIDFRNCFNLFTDIYSLTGQKQLMADVSAKIGVMENSGNREILQANLGVGYDFNNDSLSLDGTLGDSKRQYEFFGAYENNTIYANINKMFLSVKDSSINEVIDYLDHKITKGNNVVKLMDATTEIIEATEVSEIINKVKNGLGFIVLTENQLDVDLDLSVFDSSMNQVHATLTFDDQSLKTLKVDHFEVETWYFDDITITLKDYVAPSFDKTKYVAIDPAFGLLPAIDNLIESSKIRLEVSALMDRQNPDKNNLTLDGYAQIDLDNSCGYGELTLVDPNNYSHKLEANVDEEGKILFEYNDTLKGKFNTSVLNEVTEEPSGILPSVIEDEENKEDVEDLLTILTDFLEGLGSPLTQLLLDGNYWGLLEYDLIDNLVITDSSVAFDLSLELLNIGDNYANVSITFSKNSNDDIVLNTLTLSNIDLDNSLLSVTLTLKEYDVSYDAKALVEDSSFIDFTSVTTLIDFVSQTINSKYYHASGVVRAYIGDGLASMSIELDLKVRTGADGTEIVAQFNDIPIIPGVNPGWSDSIDISSKNRNATLYMCDKTKSYYIMRKDSFTFGHTKWEWIKCDEDFFLDNIGYLITKQMLWLNTEITDDMGFSKPGTSSSGGGGGSSSAPVIHYENVLKNYTFNETSTTDTFGFVIDTYELLQDSTFKKPLYFTINSNSQTQKLTSVVAEISLNTGIAFDIKLSLEMEEIEAEATASNVLTDLIDFKSEFNPDSRKINQVYRRQNGKIVERDFE